MNKRPVIRTRILAHALLLAMTADVYAAQQKTDSVPAAQAQVIRVSIPAQPLTSALVEFSKQSGVQVVYSDETMMQGLSAPAVSGSFPVGEVLFKLLGPSKLAYEFVNERTVTIRVPRGNEVLRTGNAPGDIDTVYVTGTYLKNIDPASPLIIIDEEQIRQRGFSTVEDVLRSLPQNFSSRGSTAHIIDQGEFGNRIASASPIGQSSVNLRGLGSGSTLVLVDGRRLAGSAQTMGAFTDISSIPLSQIDHVEVLTDGASAIYGADAVAGVVNIVLKKDYAGTVLRGRLERSSNGGDGRRFEVARTFGRKQGSLTLTAGYDNTKPTDFSRLIRSGQQGMGDFRNEGGINTRRQNIATPGAVYSLMQFPIPGQRDYMMVGDLLGFIPTGQNGKNFNPDTLIAPGPNQPNRSSYVLPRNGVEITRKSLSLEGQERLGDGFSLSYGAAFTRQNNVSAWQPRLADFNFLQMTNGYTPLLMTNTHNTFGMPVAVSYNYEREFAGMRLSENQKQDNLNLHLDLKGKLPWAGWKFETNLQHSQENGTGSRLGDLSSMSLSAAQYAQRIVPVLNQLNVLGDGNDAAAIQANRALLTSLVDRMDQEFSSRTNIYEGRLIGDLFAMQGGKSQLVFGAQLRDEKYRFGYTLPQATGGGSNLSKSARRVKAAYAEWGLPILSDRPLAKKLTFTVAARHERFDQNGNSSLQNYAGVFNPLNPWQSDDGIARGGFDMAAITGIKAPGIDQVSPNTQLKRSYSNTSPLARLLWEPIQDLKLRATWGKSFLTPVARQQFGDMTVQDATAYLTFIKQVPLPTGIDTVIQLRGPNASLQPQVATTKTLGLEYSPSFVPGLLSLSATYNDTNYKNFIGSPTAGVDETVIFNPATPLPKGMFVSGQNGVLLWDNRDINYLGRRSRSMDFGVSYFTSTDSGAAWRMALNATRLLSLRVQTLPGIQAYEFADSEYGPSKWVGDLFTSWQNGPYTIAFGGHYSARHRVLDPVSAITVVSNASGNAIPNANPRRTSGSYTTFDLQLGYAPELRNDWLKGISIQLGAQNIFDRTAPFVDNQYGFLTNRVNTRGRVVYFDLAYRF